jgi:hypothetical protein
MSAFNNVSVTKYINNWYGLSTPPSDPPQTVVETSQLVSDGLLTFSDNDSVEVIHPQPSVPGWGYLPYKEYTIQFTTPNDGIDHDYLFDITSTVLSPFPGVHETTPTFYLKQIIFKTFGGGYVAIQPIGGPSLWQPAPYCDTSPTNHIYGHSNLTPGNLPRNTVCGIIIDIFDSWWIPGQGTYGYISPMNDYFNYSTSVNIICADFSGSGIVVKPNTIHMIIEQN